MSRTLTPEQIDDAQRLILNAENIVVTTHKSPDGDAVGSAMAMHHFLRSIGKNPSTILPDPAPDFLHWVADYGSCILANENTQLASETIAKADLIFGLQSIVSHRGFGQRTTGS